MDVRVITPELASTVHPVVPASTTEYEIAPVPDDVAEALGVSSVSGAEKLVLVGFQVTT
jgi:hypothetical protein